MCVISWLVVCSFCDLRSRTVPAGLTLPPLLAMIVWTAVQGSWAVSIFALILFYLADVPRPLFSFLVGLLGVLLALCWMQAGLPGIVMSLSLLGVWFAWRLGAIGGADTQVLMVLTLGYGPGLLIPISVAGGIQGLIQRLRGKSSLPAMLAILTGTGFHLLKFIF